MKITKLGHCCLLIEEKDTRILTDPGSYSNAQDEVINLDAILITHEHPDHLHLESLKKVLVNNPKVKIYTNASVGEILKKEGLGFEVFKENESVQIKNTSVLGFNAFHEFIADSVPLPENTALFIAGKFLYPGDSFFIPKFSVEVLALPVAGPWLKLSEAIAYAKKVNPKKAFPVHDGMLKVIGPVHRVPKKELGDVGVEFIELENGLSFEC